MAAINIVMSQPPGPESQFIEIQDDDGHSVQVGIWSPMPPDPIDGDDGWWKLRIEIPDLPQASA